MSDSRAQPTLLELSNTFTLENRYQRDFETLTKIGTGGFGKVYKSKNLLDDTNYAVKKIVLDMENKSVRQIKNEIETVLKEIRCLAKIKNDYFVRYNHSWIEVKLKQNAQTVGSPSLNKKIEKEKEKENSLEYEEEEEFSHSLDKENSFVLSYIEDDNSILNPHLLEEKCTCERNCNCEILQFSTHLNNIKNEQQLMNNFDDDSSYRNLRKNKRKFHKKNNLYKNSNNNNNIKNSREKFINKSRTNRSDSEEVIRINKDSYKIKDIKKLKIYIQMELCKETLADVLLKKQASPTNTSFSLNLNNNNKNNNLGKNLKNILHTPTPTPSTTNINTSPYTPNNEDIVKFLEIFLHISKAVQFLHEKEQIIHRDLKPNNIFFTDDNKVKLGDFGLATDLFNMKYKKFSMETDTSLSRKNSEMSSNSYSSNENNFSISNISYHTKNIGTPQYASPEQLNNNFYDEKSDIFSLGLVLLEIVYPLKTGMEKHSVMKDLKEKGKLPEGLSKRFPYLCTLILEMTSKNASKRPTSREIIMKVKEEIKKLNLLIKSENKNSKTNNIKKIENLKTYEVMIKIENESLAENMRMKNYFIRILNEKLLIFAKKEATKALFIYDLGECEIYSTKEKDCVEIDHPIMNKIIVTGKDSSEFIEKIHTLLL